MARGKTGIAETSSGDGLEQTLSAPAGPNAAKITDVDQIIRQVSLLQLAFPSPRLPVPPLPRSHPVSFSCAARR